MKAICIIGSPKPNGSTATLVDRIIKGMRSQSIEVARYVLAEMHINYCKGCEACETSRKCIQHDDMNRLIDSIVESDIVLLASPSYWGDVTGPMKVFIDRSLPVCNANTGETPVPKGKMGIAVAVRAGSSRGETLHIVDTFEHYFDHLGISLTDTITAEDVRNKVDLTPTKLEEAYDLGRSIIQKANTF